MRSLKYIIMIFITSVILLSGCSDGRNDAQSGKRSGDLGLPEEGASLSAKQTGEQSGGSKEDSSAGEERTGEQSGVSHNNTEDEGSLGQGGTTVDGSIGQGGTTGEGSIGQGGTTVDGSIGQEGTTVDGSIGQGGTTVDGSIGQGGTTGEGNLNLEVSEDVNILPEMDASGFVSLSDMIPGVILDIRYYSTYNFVGERIDGYEEPLAFLTKEAAQALREVSDELAEKGYRLKIYDAYRPQQAVDHFVRWAQDLSDVRMKEFFYPEAEKEDLFDQGYISKHSGHSRGSTVDLTLVDAATGEDVDMGGTFDYFGEISQANYVGITKEQQENRKLLQNCMKAHGFKSISQEWWHFTLKNEPYPDVYFSFPVSRDSMN